MSVSTILTILSIVNGLLNVLKDAPEVAAEAKSLVAKVEPHALAAGTDVLKAFNDVRAKVAAL